MKKVLYLTEGIGLYTKGVKDKKEAAKLMREEAQREFDVYLATGSDWGTDFNFLPEDITEESVKEDWYYQHRSCDSETIGDDGICFQCGEPCGTGGRKCFSFTK